MKLTRTLLALTAPLLVLGATLSEAADTIRLKDGTVLEGKIVRQTAESVTLEYNVTKSIKDIRTIPVAEIAEIDKEEPDEIALNEIKALLPTADLLRPSDYQELLDDKPAEFMERFKESGLREQVQVVIDQITAEKAKAEAGGVKIDGKWISGEDAARDPYNHAAMIALAEMKLAIAARDFPLAMSKFETLEKGHGFTVAFVDSVVVAREALPKYESSLATLERGHAPLIAQREEQLKSMEPTERKLTEEAFATKVAAFEALRASESDAGKVWLPVSKWHLESIQEARETVAEQSERLAGLELEKTRTAATVLAGAIASCADGKLEEAASQLAVATTNGARGDVVTKLREDIRTAKLAAEEAARAALAAGENPGGETTDPPGETPGGTEKPGGETEPEPGTGEAVAETKPKPAPKTSGGSSKEGGLGIQGILMIVAGILIVVTVVAKMLIKPPEEELE